MSAFISADMTKLLNIRSHIHWHTDGTATWSSVFRPRTKDWTTDLLVRRPPAVPPEPHRCDGNITFRTRLNEETVVETTLFSTCWEHRATCQHVPLHETTCRVTTHTDCTHTRNKRHTSTKLREERKHVVSVSISLCCCSWTLNTHTHTLTIVAAAFRRNQ